MNFIGEIGSLTLPQIQEYLSGQRPFPGGQMALTAHMPALAAQAVRMKMKDGGEVPQIDERMQALLMQRFARGGEVYSLDAEGRMIGKRKATDPALNGEVSFEPVPEGGGKSVFSKNMAVYNAQGERIGKRRASEPLLQGEQTAEPMPLGIALPDASGVIGRSVDDLRGIAGAVSPIKGLGWIGNKISENYSRQQALRDAATRKPVDSTKILNELGLGDEPAKPDMAGLNAAIDKGQIPPMTDAAKAEQEAFRQANNIGGAGVGNKSITSFGLGDLPALPDTAGIVAALNKREKDLGTTDPKLIKEEMRGILGIKDRSEQRLKDVDALKSGLESDREMGKWMALAQFAAGMAGKRNIAEGMAGGIEKGVPAFAATQAAYRKGMGEAADKQMRIEDAADTIERELGTNALNLSDKRKAEIAQIAEKQYGIKKDVFNAGLELYKARTDAEYKQGYLKALETKAVGGLTPYQMAQIRDKAIDNMKNNPEYVLAMAAKDRATADALLQKEVDRLLAQGGVSGTMPAGASTVRDSKLWGEPTLVK